MANQPVVQDAISCHRSVRRPMATAPNRPFSLASRLIVGTGKYDTLELMRIRWLPWAPGGDRAVRRERMYDRRPEYPDYVDPSQYLLLPNTAGCYNAVDAVASPG